MLCINIENIETIAILQYCESARKLKCLPLSPIGLPSEEEETPYGPRRELYQIAEHGENV